MSQFGDVLALPLRHRGKVRELYSIPGDENTILLVATDTVSAFDHVLPTAIPNKGTILTQLSLWWFEQLADVVDNHVVSTEVPEPVRGRAMIVEALDMIEVECVARGYLTGSGWAEYQATRTVCGIPLPDGLRDGDRLPEPIFTPAIKAKAGEHDENVDFATLARMHGEELAQQLRELTLRIYGIAESLAAQRGIILADTKVEFGRRRDGTVVLADEVLTPDSSRFWDAQAWRPGESLPSFDKQFVRDWLVSSSGWDKDSGTPAPPLPKHVVTATEERYREAYRRLTGSDIDLVALGVPEDPDAEEWLDWFATLDDEQRATHRRRIVVSGLEAGLTLQAVGDLYGVTRERIRQLAAAQGISTKEVRARQKARADRRQRQLARHIYGTSLTYPELEIAELADRFETDEDTVRKALGHRVAVHEVRANPWVRRTSEEALLQALAQWARETESLTGDSYTAWAEDRGIPGKQTVAHRFGSWNTALVLAGVRQVSGRGGPRPQVHDDEIWAGLVEFFQADLPGFSALDYDAYARSRNLASLGTARNRLGTWAEIQTRVRALLRYAADRDGSWPWGEAVLSIIPGAKPRRVSTRESALASLRAVAARFDGALTVARYEALRQPGETVSTSIQRHCGSWINALHLAGLHHRMSVKARGKVERGEIILGPAPARPSR